MYELLNTVQCFILDFSVEEGEGELCEMIVV